MGMRISLADPDPDTVLGHCDGCAAELPAWALYVPLESEPWPASVCGNCLDAALPVTIAATPTGWESETGKWLKAQRDLLLDYGATGWAIMPDSPLSTDSEGEFRAYRAKLNRMTVDYTPETWTWPDRPTPRYPA